MTKLEHIANKLQYHGYIANHATWREYEEVCVMNQFGSARIHLYQKIDDDSRLILGNLNVTQKYQRCGKARLLMKLAESLAKQFGMRDIELCVSKDAPTWLIKWYERLGYKFDSYDDDNDLIMIKTLNYDFQ